MVLKLFLKLFLKKVDKIIAVYIMIDVTRSYKNNQPKDQPETVDRNRVTSTLQFIDNKLRRKQK